MPVMSIVRDRQAWKKSFQVADILNKLELHEHHEIGQYSKKKINVIMLEEEAF